MPTDGVREWFGWSFTSPQFWGDAGGQNRPLFNVDAGGLGDGVIAVADSDEWDDTSHGPGRFESYLISPAIDISGQPANSLTRNFEGSWRPEGDQTAIIEVSYDGGANYNEIRRFSSDPTSPDFVDHVPQGD